MAALLGAVVTRHPGLAVPFTGLAVVTLLAVLAPVTHLSILLALTAIVPCSIQKLFPGGARIGSAGVLLSDLFLLTGLMRVVLVLPL
jgi:hypothetical protein